MTDRDEKNEREGDLLDDYCPQCGAFTGGDSVCPTCGANLFDDSGLTEYNEDIQDGDFGEIDTNDEPVKN